MADVDDVEFVAFQRETVVRRCHRGDRRWWDVVHLVPQERAGGDTCVRLLDDALGRDDAGSEPVGEQLGSEPVVPVAVGDVDIGQLASLRGDAFAEIARRRRSKAGVAQDGALPSADPGCLRPVTFSDVLIPRGQAASFRRAQRGSVSGQWLTMPTRIAPSLWSSSANASSVVPDDTAFADEREGKVVGERDATGFGPDDSLCAEPPGESCARYGDVV